MAAKVQSVTAEERFWRQVDKTGGCWLWTGYLKPNGYASFYPGGGRHVPKVYAHRFAYELTGRTIPEGHQLDHLCNVRHCVNPRHLEVVTHRVNLDRAVERRTHCQRGHAFDEANTYVWRGNRFCRTCRVERMSIARGV